MKQTDKDVLIIERSLNVIGVTIFKCVLQADFVQCVFGA